MKKIISVIIASATVISAFVGCSTDTAEKTTAVSASASASKYADWLTTRLDADGITPDSEIIVGNAADAEAYGIDMSGIMDDGYIIRRADSADETLIFGKTDLGTDMAVRYFANYCDKTGPLNVVEGEGYRVGSITIAGKDLSEYVIVCPADADECQRFAADELQRFLGDACGIYPEIVTESDGYAITLVRDVTGEAYGDEAFNIKSHDRGITITGGRYRGCMYGVYEFLEKYIGYRFYYRNLCASGDIAAADAYLYEAESITLGNDIDLTESPSIQVRDTYGSGTSSPAVKYNGERFRYNAKYGGYGDVIKACHGYSGFISDEELEQMGYCAGYKYGTNPCYTDEELNSVFHERILAYCENKVKAGAIPGKDFTTIDISQHDITTFCQCSDCMSVYARSGSTAGTMVNLANSVAKMLEEDYPELKVGILAYSGTDKPPRNMTIHENVYVSYCFYISLSGHFVCGNHSINGEECSTNKFFATQFDGWAALTDNLYVWYYPFQAYYLAYSSTYTFNLLADIKYLADKNTYGIFWHGEGDRITQTYNPGLINIYLSQRLMWNADITEEEFHEMMKEYLYLTYGDGYESVYDYITIMEKAANMQDCFCGFHTAIMNRLDFSYIKKNIELLLALRDDAVRRARTSEQEELCDRIFASVYYYELVTYHTDMWVNGTEETRAEFKEKVDYFITNYKNLPISEMGLGTPTYAPSLDEVDYNTNPLEWMQHRLGGWNDNFDF